MRCFIGLDLAPADKLAMESWREHSLPALSAAVPAANFHITLAFLGQVTQSQLEPLCSQLDQLRMPKVEVCFDQIGFWSKPKILFIGCKQVPQALGVLAEQCKSAALKSGINQQQQNYVPHITLARKIKQNPPYPVNEPRFQLHFDRFHLFESASTSKGVRYPIRQSWPT